MCSEGMGQHGSQEFGEGFLGIFAAISDIFSPNKTIDQNWGNLWNEQLLYKDRDAPKLAA